MGQVGTAYELQHGTKRGIRQELSRRSLLLGLGVAAVTPAWTETRGVEVGVCGPVKHFQEAVKYGFDYFEAGVAEIAAMSNDAFADFRKQVLASPLRCTSCNSFIRTLHVVGPTVDRDALTSYMSSSLDRCTQLGTRIVVWGSAGSRNVPQGFSRSEARSQIKAFLRQAGDLARSRNIVIAIEPLRRQESNIINTGAEALQLVREVDHPQVKMIIDYYHLRAENENPDILLRAAKEIVHLHFANAAGRRWPKLSDGDPVYARFFELVKQIRFRGGISIEGQGTFEADARDSLQFFRQELS